jgi:DNA replication protein DnaC
MNTALIEEYLKMLKLPGALAHYRRLAEVAKHPIAYLGEVLAAEIERRHENGIKQRIAAAHLPTIKTLESFDFTLQQNVPKTKLLALADGTFIRERRNEVFYGPPGTGKTHCLIAISFAACTLGYRTLFTTAAGLLTSLLDAKRNGTLARKLQSLDRFALLAIDELGYIPFEREATDLLFHVISQRYERASIAITTNLAFEQWTQIFPDAMAARAVIDRLIHHGSVFEFAGESQRLKGRAQPQNPKTEKNDAK